jgi:hypothetical protein
VRLPDDVFKLLARDPAIVRVDLAGSRGRGDALPESDWDFKITTDAFAEVQGRLPALAARLSPMAAQWDRLSSTWCYMLILAGPVKVDLIFTEPHSAQPAWQVTAATLPGIDAHFWDWMLWLSTKQHAGKADLVAPSSARCTSICWLRSASQLSRPCLARPSRITVRRAGSVSNGCDTTCPALLSRPSPQHCDSPSDRRLTNAVAWPIACSRYWVG